MTPHPYRRALLLATATVLGFCGLLVTPGWWGLPFLLLAAAPLAAGLVGYARTSTRRAAAVSGRSTQT